MQLSVTYKQRMRTARRVCWSMLWAAIGAVLQISATQAQETRFFRIVGPGETTITHVSADGRVGWTNVPINATFTVQTTTNLETSDWNDWVQVPATNGTTFHRLFDPNPPGGMAFIPAGTFLMGDTFGEGDADELPVHTVYVSAFHMDKCEVTKALWDNVRDWSANYGYNLGSVGSGKSPNHPVHSISWREAAKWCNARSEMEGLEICYFVDPDLTTPFTSNNLISPFLHVSWSANGYRLPTEAEWEKAARGGTGGRRFPWPEPTISHDRANYAASTDFPYDASYPAHYHPAFNDGIFPFTSPVGYFPPNGYGLHDMGGNVWEMCWDGYSTSYYASSPAVNPSGHATNTDRVIRGNGWHAWAYNSRVTRRWIVRSGDRVDAYGLRCVRTTWD